MASKFPVPAPNQSKITDYADKKADIDQMNDDDSLMSKFRRRWKLRGSRNDQNGDISTGKGKTSASETASTVKSPGGGAPASGEPSTGSDQSKRSGDNEAYVNNAPSLQADTGAAQSTGQPGVQPAKSTETPATQSGTGNVASNAAVITPSTQTTQSSSTEKTNIPSSSAGPNRPMSQVNEPSSTKSKPGEKTSTVPPTIQGNSKQLPLKKPEYLQEGDPSTAAVSGVKQGGSLAGEIHAAVASTTGSKPGMEQTVAPTPATPTASGSVQAAATSKSAQRSKASKRKLL